MHGRRLLELQLRMGLEILPYFTLTLTFTAFHLEAL